MSDNLKIFLSEFDNLKGQFVITDCWKIERLIAIGEDELDYYYITFDGRNIRWNTCVGRIMPLKGHLRDEDYNYMIHIAKMNHYDQLVINNKGNIDDFIKSFEKETANYTHGERFLTEICWTIN